jgi:hypothetical protein
MARPRAHTLLSVRRSLMDESNARGSRYWVAGYPHLVEQWHAERNGTLTPETVSSGSGRMIWWKCAKGRDHVWRAKPNNRTRGVGCPFCANRKVSNTNNLAICSPWIAAEWHPKRNGAVTPEDVMAGSSRVCWWRCSANADHEWRASVRDRTRGQTQCPYCTHRRVSTECSLAWSHPALASEWHPTRNGRLSPDDVTPGSSRKVWWLCLSDATHVWRTAVTNRFGRASGCPFCGGRLGDGNARSAAS